MVKIFAIAAGGSIGSVARYFINITASKITPNDFPLGTLTANLAGCLLIGFLWSYFDRVHISNEFRLFLFTGFLGGFTTFSTFARETEQFFKSGQVFQGVSYLVLSNCLGISMVALGILICNRFFR